MIESVWLKKQIIRSLEQTDNVLYYSHRNLLDICRAESDVLWLCEPDGRVGVCLSCCGTDISETNDKPLPPEYASLSAAVDAQTFAAAEDGILLPLRDETTSVFGAVLLRGVPAEKPDGAVKKLLAAFGSVLYREAMGAIIQSYFPKVLQVRGLEMSYDQKNKILKGIDLDLCESEFTVILGSSGCGKTTMMNAVGGMLTPTGGEILWNGKNIVTMRDRDLTAYRREAIGFVFQQYNLISDLTARENVQVGASFVKDPMPAEEALAYVGLSQKANQYPGKMSGGEQQRVCIARAIAKRSRILLCDEPTGALDPDNASVVMQLLQRLVRENGIAVIMITHNTAFSVLADHSVLMSAGRIIEDVRQPFPMRAEQLQLR